MPDQIPPLADRIEKSTQVCLFEYDAPSSELRVIFRTNPALYAYKKFPAVEFERVIAEEPSIGSYLIRCVSRRPQGGGPLPYQFDKRDLTTDQMAMWKATGEAYAEARRKARDDG
jgi:hypothetical protein